MKKILLLAATVALFSMMVVQDAQAKRLGGGGGSGRQSNNVSRQMPAQSNQMANKAAPAPTPGPAAPAKPASPWKGILGGALLGLGLGALFSSLGMSGALSSILGGLLMAGLVVIVVGIIYRLLRGKNNMAPQPAMATPYAGAYADTNANTHAGNAYVPPVAGVGASGNVAANESTWSIPAGFDVDAFLRQAKTHFIRLQAAWDKSDIRDITEFTTPEMFAELKLQLQERGAQANITDVVSLDAQLLGIETTEREHLASIKFSGMIKESEHATTEYFVEVWNLTKAINGAGGWLLAGIQQVS